MTDKLREAALWKLLTEAREALWQPANPDLCGRIDEALAQQDAQAVQQELSEAFRAELDKVSQRNFELRMEIASLKATPTPPAPKPLGWLAREAVECLQGAEMTWMPVWNRQCSSDPVPIFLGPSGVRWNEKLAIIFGEDHGKDC